MPPGLRPLATILAATSLFAACEVEWGGGRLALEQPVPPADTTGPAEAEPEERRLAPIPRGPFLYLVRLEGDGSARVVPAARLAGGAPAPLALPDTIEERWRTAFDSAHLASGRELHLHAAGARIGTLVLGDVRSAPDPACASTAVAAVLVPPGQTLPAYAIALPPEVSPEPPRRIAFPEPTRQMAVAGPVLAERYIGGERAFLARRAALRAVRTSGDTAPAMAATYLVADTLGPVPPEDDAISLFFLARRDLRRGYVTEWVEVRRYAAEDKEAYAHLDWFRGPAGRVDLLRLYTARDVRLAASLRPRAAEGEEVEREITWTESPGCSALALLGDAATTSVGEAAAAAP